MTQIMCMHSSFYVRMNDETNIWIVKMQRYTMADQYENVALADFDVVRSTQFVDDLTQRVHVSYALVFKFIKH